MTLTGAGGVGKTRLAFETAAASSKAFPGGVWLVDLSPVHDPVTVPGATATALGVADQGTRPVLEHLVAGPDDRQAELVLASALVYHWVAGGCLGEGRRQLERALKQAPEPTAARARALVAAGFVAQLQYDLAVSDQWLEEARYLAERLDEPALHAHATGHLGGSALYRGRPEEALPFIEQAIAAHAGRGDRLGEVTWQCALAIVQTVSGNPRAPQTSAQALAATQAQGERWARAHRLMTLGRHAWALGEQAEAQDLTLMALEMLRGFGNTIGVAKMVEQLAWITASHDDHTRAGRLLGAASSLRHVTGINIAAGDPREEAYHAQIATWWTAQ